MQVPKCFYPQGSFSRIPGSKGLIGGLLPTPSYKLHCYKYPLPRTLCYCRLLQILAALLFFHLPTPFLWCFALAGTCGKRYGSFIVLAVWAYRLGYLPGTKLEKTQRTSPPASDYIWFWYICCSTKPSRKKHNF